MAVLSLKVFSGDRHYLYAAIARWEDAAMRVDFGRKIKMDKVVLYTRSDFPHDN